MTPERAPALTRDEITEANRAYHDAIVDSYDERGEGTSPYVHDYYRRLMNEHVFARLGPHERVSCIDIGCGSGYLEEFLGPGYDVLGVDVSPGMLERARERYPEVDWVCADLYEYEPPRTQYDLVMEKAVLHHLKDYDVIVEKMARLTAPGGVLLLSNEPNALSYRLLAPLKWLFRRVMNRDRGELAEARLGDTSYETLSEYHLFYGNGINAFALRRRLQAAGFTDVRLFFSLRELFATLEDAWPWLKLNALVPDIVANHFPLARNFHLVATKR